MTDRRTWLPFAVAALLAVSGVVVVVITGRTSPLHCASTVPASSPLVAPDRFGEDDRLATLARSVAAMPAPFGPVRAGVGYNYGQWLHLYAVNAGLLAFTKRNAAVTLLDGQSLKARWALEPATKRIAWDASGRTLLLLDLDARGSTRIGRYDLDGKRQDWCVSVPFRHRDGEPVATAFVGPDADVLVALPGAGKTVVLSRLATGDGAAVWVKKLKGVDRADFLGTFVNDLAIIGGTEEFQLAKVDPTLRSQAVIAAVRTTDGSKAWTWKAPAGTKVHVIGTTGDEVLVMTRSAAGSQVRALDADGQELWHSTVVAGELESTVRGGQVLTRSASGLAAYDVTTGKLLWHRPIPTDRTYFPYGFTLSQMPSLDATHLLVPTTTSLLVLDTATGKSVEYPLPTDGVSTTYWPYQLLATPHLIGVVTNTGAVLDDRSD